MKFKCCFKVREKISYTGSRMVVLDVVIKEDKPFGKTRKYIDAEKFEVSGRYGEYDREKLIEFASKGEEELKNYFLRYIRDFVKKTLGATKEQQAIAKIKGGKMVIEFKEES